MLSLASRAEAWLMKQKSTIGQQSDGRTLTKFLALFRAARLVHAGPIHLMVPSR